MATIPLDFTISPANLSRAVPALKDKFGLPADATGSQVLAALKSEVRRQIVGIVRDYEAAEAAKAAVDPITEIDLT